MSVRSLGAAAAGIDTMQTDLDTIGIDIANSETDGFASQTAEFSDLLTEQLQPAGGAVGQTGVDSNVAIEGNGFLIVSQNGHTYYTLDGDLQIDANGNLATNSGG